MSKINSFEISSVGNSGGLHEEMLDIEENEYRVNVKDGERSDEVPNINEANLAEQEIEINIDAEE